MIFIILSSRAAIEFDKGFLLFPLVLIGMVIVTRLSPPVTALFFLFGWVLINQLGIVQQGISRIPAFSIFSVWTFALLIFRRSSNVPIKNIFDSAFIKYIILLLIFFAIGFFGAFYRGHLKNPLVGQYIFDIVRGWIGFLMIAFLGCRDIEDFKVIIIGLPFAFLIYPLSLPLESWLRVLYLAQSTTHTLNIGLGYGSLNTDILGQGAAVAIVVAAAVFFCSKQPLLRILISCLVLVLVVITSLTGARQSIVSILIGLTMIAIFLGIRNHLLNGILLLIFIVIFAFGTSFLIINLLPEDSGLVTRLADITKPIDNWSTNSASERIEDFKDAITVWLEAPVFGVGFGGQRILEVPPFADSSMSGINYLMYGTHNLVLGIMVQTGIFGLTLFFFFCAGITRHFFKITKKIYKGSGKLRHNIVDISVIAVLACIATQQNISGGIGIASSYFIFLMGCMLGVISWWIRLTRTPKRRNL